MLKQIKQVKWLNIATPTSEFIRVYMQKEITIKVHMQIVKLRGIDADLDIYKDTYVKKKKS